jgi:putative peptidoglycan lipid II flippase
MAGPGQRQLAELCRPPDGVPHRLLGVALGVVLTPQLACARRRTTQRYSDMLDWGLRLVVLLAVPCLGGAADLLQPLVATLYHYGAFKDSDVQQDHWR